MNDAFSSNGPGAAGTRPRSVRVSPSNETVASTGAPGRAPGTGTKRAVTPTRHMPTRCVWSVQAESSSAASAGTSSTAPTPQSQPPEHWHLRMEWIAGTELPFTWFGSSSGASARCATSAARRGDLMRTSIAFAPSRRSFLTSKRQRRNWLFAEPARRPFTKTSATVSIESNERKTASCDSSAAGTSNEREKTQSVSATHWTLLSLSRQ